MPPSISSEDVARLASLANLELSPPEIARITRDLGAILDYVAELAEVDVEGVPPTTHVEIERLALRADEPRPSLGPDLALREAPKQDGGGFAVPAFMDEG